MKVDSMLNEFKVCLFVCFVLTDMETFFCWNSLGLSLFLNVYLNVYLSVDGDDDKQMYG